MTKVEAIERVITILLYQAKVKIKLFQLHPFMVLLTVILENSIDNFSTLVL